MVAIRGRIDRDPILQGPNRRDHFADLVEQLFDLAINMWIFVGSRDKNTERLAGGCGLILFSSDRIHDELFWTQSWVKEMRRYVGWTAVGMNGCWHFHSPI